MMDFFRTIGQSADEKRAETLNAYLDGALSPREQQLLEVDLQQDAALRAELEQLRVVKLQLQSLPSRRVPRSFSLDPALYGPPKANPTQQLYPLLRGATAMTALLFVFVLGLSLFDVDLGAGDAAPAQAVTMAEPAAEMDTYSAEAPVAELELEPPPPAAEAGIAIEEPALESAAGAAAESAIAEESALEATEEMAVAPQAEGRATADITSRKDITATTGALATGELQQDALADTAEESAATSAAFALPPDAEAEPASTSTISPIALWLGLATLVLGIATLFVRSRASL